MNSLFDRIENIVGKEKNVGTRRLRDWCIVLANFHWGNFLPLASDACKRSRQLLWTARKHIGVSLTAMIMT